MKTIGMLCGMSWESSAEYYRFVNQIVADIECAYGDSGSLLVDEENRAVGLLFGGTRSGHTWFNPFNAVCEALDIELLDENARPARGER